GYTRLDSEITESMDASEVGNSLSNSPENSFNLWGTYTVGQSLQLGLGAQYVDERYNSTANTRKAPDYWVYEASATYVLSDRLSVRLIVPNLTDVKDINYVGAGNFIPGVGRMALLSSSFSF